MTVANAGNGDPFSGEEFVQQIALLANQIASGAPPASAATVPAASLPSVPSFPATAPTGVPSLPTPGHVAFVPLVPGFPESAAPSVFSHLGPSAAAPSLMGGLSTASHLPPLPGALHSPPLAAAPAPKESDLRAGTSFVAEQAGLPFGALATSSLAGTGLQSVVNPFDAPSPALASPDRLTALVGAVPSPAGASPPAPLPGGAPSTGSVPYAGAGAPSISGVPYAGAGAPSIGGVPYAGAGAPSSASVPYGGTGAAAPVSLDPGVRRDDGGAVRSSAIELPAFRPELAPFERDKPGLFDPYSIRRDFPILNETVRGKPLVWLDNAATTQKPQAVIDRLSYYYTHENSNIHRAAHTLAARATDAYEGARERVRAFLNAPTAESIVFTRGTTEAINLVAQSWGRKNLTPGDEILITWLEHHANIVPWQQLALEKGAVLRVAPVDDRGQVIPEAYERLLGPRTKLVSISQVSNALGTVVPVREMTQMAHRYGACVLVDGAQAVSHMRVDVQDIDCEFYVFSGHKVFAPTGIGALYGKRAVLEAMPPWQGGGNMIKDVRFERTTYQGSPFRFEAGTGNIADAVGLGAAIDYVTAIGMENISRYEHELLVYATSCLATVPGLTMIGTSEEKAGVLSFVLDGQRTEDVGGMLDQEGIAVRSGHHCAQPILRRFGLESTVRASLAPYNTREDIDALTRALHRIQIGRPVTSS
ncbi:MAG TPA: family 2A encapsulin nanocompartment cargo protein cysteine desulfurase [Polyangiaceae bacterium]|nr:family 2A encapsulin nanocompartment cargo protein cysteine desulfurase [Polyangiaceae bacterium]